MFPAIYLPLISIPLAQEPHFPGALPFRGPTGVQLQHSPSPYLSANRWARISLIGVFCSVHVPCWLQSAASSFEEPHSCPLLSTYPPPPQSDDATEEEFFSFWLRSRKIASIYYSDSYSESPLCLASREISTTRTESKHKPPLRSTLWPPPSCTAPPELLLQIISPELTVRPYVSQHGTAATACCTYLNSRRVANCNHGTQRAIADRPTLGGAVTGGFL